MYVYKCIFILIFDYKVFLDFLFSNLKFEINLTLNFNHNKSDELKMKFCIIILSFHK